MIRTRLCLAALLCWWAAAAAPALTLLSESGRAVFTRVEAIDVALSTDIPEAGAAAGAAIELWLDAADGSRLRVVSDQTGPVPAGRHDATYSLFAGAVDPGSYRLRARLTLGDKTEEATLPLEIVPDHRLTAFHILHLGSVPGWVLPTERVVEDSKRYHFNFMMTNVCDSWHRGGAGVGLTGPEQTMEGLLRAGIDFMKYPTGYGWGLAHRPIRGGASWYDPDIVAISAQLMEYHMQGARRSPACVGLNPIDEPGVSWTDPFMAAEFRKRTGLDVPDEKADRSQDRDRFVAYETFRNHALNDFNQLMKRHMRKVAPAAEFTVQTFADILTRAGLYPTANTCQDLQSTHIYDHWPTSNNWMAFAVNLRRTGDLRKKRLDVVTGCYGIFPDQWRAAWALGMSEGIDGHGYFLGAGELPEDQPWGEYNLAEMVRINRLCERYGDFFQALERPPAPVVVWYSFAQTAVADPHRQYPQEPVGAFFALKRAHIPAGVVADEDIRAGRLGEHKVLFVVGMDFIADDLARKIAEFQRHGGKVVVDRATTVAIQGAIRLDADFREFAANIAELERAWAEGRMPTSMLLRRDLTAEAGILRDLPNIRKTFEALVEIPADATSPHTFLTVKQSGKARYVFIANEASVIRHPNEKGRWINMQESVPAEEELTLPVLKGMAVYDLWTGERLTLDKQNKLRLRLPAAGLRVLCGYPEAIREPGLRIITGRHDALIPEPVPARGNSGALPVHVTFMDPAGKVAGERFASLSLARADYAAGPEFYDPLLVAAAPGLNRPAGVWRAELTNLLTGRTATATLDVPAAIAAAAEWAGVSEPPSVAERRAVLLLDERAPYQTLARRQPLVVPGAGCEAQAQALAAKLKCEVRTPEEIRQPDTYPDFLDPVQNKGVWMMPRWQPLSLTVGNHDLILLGTPANNILIKDLNAGGMLQRVIHPSTLGRGEGLVQYCWSPFDLDRDAVVVAAYDATGLEAACRRLLDRIAGDATVASVAPDRAFGIDEVVFEPAPAPATPPRAPTPETLAPVVHQRLTDSVQKLAAGGGLVAVGGLDSRLSVFDEAGKLLWQREFDYRVTGVAVSPDGQRVAAHAFPRTYVYDRQGHLLDFFAEAEPSLDDVEGMALQTPADRDTPSLVRGTWTGIVKATAADGRLLWQFPPAAPKPEVVEKAKKEGKDLPPPPAPISGAVRKIVFLPDGSLAVAAMQELVILDQSGKEVRRTRIDRLQDAAPAGDKLAVASFKKKVMLFDAAGGKLWEKETPDFVMALAAVPDGQRIAAALFGGEVIVFDATGEIVRHARLPFEATLTGVAFDAQGETLWLATWEGDLVGWPPAESGGR